MIPARLTALGRLLFTTLAYALQRVRKALWKVTGRPAGAHALPITPEGRLVLVRLTYASGWRLPGGGLKRGEAPEAGVLRELREEIGMEGFDRILRVGGTGEDPALGALFIVRGVVYRPRRSLEIERVEEFEPDALPAGATARTRRWVGQILTESPLTAH